LEVLFIWLDSLFDSLSSKITIEAQEFKQLSATVEIT